MEQKKQKTQTRNVLGRGLSALISSPPVAVSRIGGAGEAPQLKSNDVYIPRAEVRGSTLESTPHAAKAAGAGEGVSHVSLALLIPNPKQPRQDFSEAELSELSESIRTLGVLQPILVRPSSSVPGSLEIVAGERRWRASQRAGLQQVPVIVRALGDKETLEISIVENVQRENLNPVEQALAYQRLIQEFNLGQQEVAERVGKDRASVANFLRLLKLPPEVLELVRKAELSTGHAKAILSVKEPTAQLSLARKVLKEDLSVRDLEAIVSRVVVLDSGRRAKGKGTSAAEEQQFPEVMDRLRGALATKVTLKHSKSGAGRIEIEYFSEAELDRLVEHLCRN